MCRRDGPYGLEQVIFTGLQPRRLGKLIAENGGEGLPPPRSPGRLSAGVMSGCARPEAGPRRSTCRCFIYLVDRHPGLRLLTSATRRWPHCTGCTRFHRAQRARSGRCGRCWPAAGSPCTVSRGAAAHPGRRLRLRRRRAAWNCGSTGRKCRSGAPARGSRAAARSCRARKSRTRRRPRSSPTGKAAPCGRARSGRAGCTTRPRCGPRASPFSPPVPPGQSRVAAGYPGLTRNSRTRSRPRR